MGGPNNKRILIPRKRVLIFDMIKNGYSDSQIQQELGRPDLDVPYFRTQVNSQRHRLIW